ncbi:hypothetical protein OEZ85_005629 [Tetradesmus obliquus]|uniref:DNA helicase n=1 Tax=Tetradesmus obliquus TaxID=3088 RepID=A0ABY8UGA4_TETOB|nr:hypothetical protein OEZ85_005629 [Tetradesmus obliquus]
MLAAIATEGINSRHQQQAAGGIESLPQWSEWGDAQLLAAWQAAVAELPAAVEALKAVSFEGPVKLVCFDLETCTNIQPVDITELAAATVDATFAPAKCLNSDPHTFASLVSPLTMITPEASNITGITWGGNQLQHQPPLPVVLLDWVRWLQQQCASAPGGSSTLVLMGHNIKSFDLPALRNWAGALQQPLLEQLLQHPTAKQAKSNAQPLHAYWPCIDTLIVARKLKAYYNNAQKAGVILDSSVDCVLQQISGENGTQLQKLRETFRFEANQAHRALADVLVNLQVFTKQQCEKLAAAGLNNMLQVLTYAPKIEAYADAIRVSSAAAATAGSGSSSWAKLLQGDASSSDDEGGSAAEGQYVNLLGRVVAARPPASWNGNAVWSAAYEVPAHPPEAGPLYLKISHFEFGGWGQRSMQAASAGYKEAKQAAAQQQQVLLTGKVRLASGDRWSTVGGFDCSWENQGTMTVEYLAAAGADASSPSSSSSSIDSDGPTAAAAAGEPAGPPSSSSSSSSGGSMLLPSYKTVKELKSNDWRPSSSRRGIIDRALDTVRAAPNQGELLPPELLVQYGLPDFFTALQGLHKPADMDAHVAARRRLAFQELLLVQMAQLLERYWLQRNMQGPCSAAGAVVAAAAAAPTLAPVSEAAADASSSQDEAPQAGTAAKKRGRPKSPAAAAAAEDQPEVQAAAAAAAAAPLQQQQQQQQGGSTAYIIPESAASIVETAKQQLPYQLTPDQQSSLSEVLADLAKPQAMLRLLQGDVGCGKTVVAVMACLAVRQAGYQALLLAPTELLASQHLATLNFIAERLPLSLRPRIELLTGSLANKEKAGVKARLAAGEVDLLVATQAALWLKGGWSKLALVVVDEQHKFGVKQRERLLQGLSVPPHMLLMSATPIPRTLALVQYGGLVLSTIASMPPGRSRVATQVVVDAEEAREQVYAAIREELATGGRVYIVCPLVSESSSDALAGVKAAEEEHERLVSSRVFDAHGCGLLHGKMKQQEKEAVLTKFNSGETPVLISSTVVEVGIDEPEASVMLVENAERFGLAQLHQLRGRVGRGSRPSRCFLIAPAAGSSESAAAAAKRLRVLERSHNGLVIAQADLEIRGPGDVWGTKQSGKSSVFSSLTWQELEASPQLLDHARAAAAALLPQLGSSPQLKAAMLAYNLMQLREGGQLPMLREGVSGV